MSDPEGFIHFEHPFVTPPALRTPARRLRGHLAAPVTVWTSGVGRERTGLTVSSILVAEGEPARVLGLVGELSDLWEAIRRSGAFVMHVLAAGDRELADRFAGVLPSPGGLFRGLAVEDSEWGPVLTGLDTRAYCRLETSLPTGRHLLLVGSIERVALGEIEQPLVHFRGRYLRNRTSPGEAPP